MKLSVNAACVCNKGIRRANNEDNFYFNGKYLEAQNNGLKEALILDRDVSGNMLFAVFDGMGGEDFGEEASYTAAKETLKYEKGVFGIFLAPEKYLSKLISKQNTAVVKRKNELQTEHMGSTVAALCIKGDRAWVCNLGDSRVYRLEGESLKQLSEDHTETMYRGKGKAPLTQHLGIDPKYMRIIPYISGISIDKEDRFLICSDGITDMLSDDEICNILKKKTTPKACVEKLVEAALDKGGRDNITAIVCTFGKGGRP